MAASMALRRQAILFGQLGGLGVAIGQGQQEQFAGDELVAALQGFFFGGLQQLAQIGANLHLVVPLHLGQLLHGVFYGGGQGGHIHPGALQQGFRPLVLAQHGRQQVQRVDVGMVVAQRQGLGIGEGFLKLGGEFVDTHEIFSFTTNKRVVAKVAAFFEISRPAPS